MALPSNLDTHRITEDKLPAARTEGTLPTKTILQERYEILAVQGIGGMGAVYQARDLRFGTVSRIIAVKEMMNTAPDPRLRQISVQNFEREANILASLSHPAIPKIFDFFSESSRSYLVLEFVDGQTLEEILGDRRKPFDQEEVLDWALQVCDVLAYLHSQKPPVIFRDMKPDNLMLRHDGRLMVIDFGIAKVFEQGQRGTMIGTEGYSPPEQYRGVADPRGDLYALGATLPSPAHCPRPTTRAAVHLPRAPHPALQPRHIARVPDCHHQGPGLRPRRPLQLGSRNGPGAEQGVAWTPAAGRRLGRAGDQCCAPGRRPQVDLPL